MIRCCAFVIVLSCSSVSSLSAESREKSRECTNGLSDGLIASGDVVSSSRLCEIVSDASLPTAERLAALRHLDGVKDEKCIPTLVENIDLKSNPKEHSEAMRMIVKIGEPAVPFLLKGIKDAIEKDGTKGNDRLRDLVVTFKAIKGGKFEEWIAVNEGRLDEGVSYAIHAYGTF